MGYNISVSFFRGRKKARHISLDCCYFLLFLFCFIYFREFVVVASFGSYTISIDMRVNIYFCTYLNMHWRAGLRIIAPHNARIILSIGFCIVGGDFLAARRFVTIIYSVARSNLHRKFFFQPNTALSGARNIEQCARIKKYMIVWHMRINYSLTSVIL